ncbi:MAG: hypothetical protein GEU86_12470 [Actinophytocola sp.]|nr:hypothetical protein [Actinophytocola sp.]
MVAVVLAVAGVAAVICASARSRSTSLADRPHRDAAPTVSLVAGLAAATTTAGIAALLKYVT